MTLEDRVYALRLRLFRRVEERGWSHLRMLSSASNTFNTDYLAEAGPDLQVLIMTVFRKNRGTFHHCYASEVFYCENEPGQHSRHVDMALPLRNVFDLTTEGHPRRTGTARRSCRGVSVG